MKRLAHANVWTALLGGAFVAAGCSEAGSAETGSGGAPSDGGSSNSTGGLASGGTPVTGGALSSSGGIAAAMGGTNANTGGASTGGTPLGTGGANADAGGGAAPGNGGSTSGGSGGRAALGGAGAGGSSGGNGPGGRANSGGTAGMGVGVGGAGGSTASTGCGVNDALKSGRASIDVAGTMREYILKVPDGYSATKPYKLIFAFHWKGGNADNVATGSIGGGPYYGLEQRAAGSTIFVAPEGIDAGFANTGGRDSALVRALLSLLNSKLCIDQQRIFSTGFSYGGMMSDSIGCEMADVFRAIAPMSGAIPNAAHPYSGCKQTNAHPVAVWMSHGDTDNVVPLADGKAALALFVARNQCQAQTSPVAPSPCVAYQGCATGYPIHWCQFSGGHTAPSFASAAIWNFFSQF